MAKGSSSGSPQSSKDLVSKFQKTYGESTATIGVRVHQRKRCPTGVFPFDYATGGGLPFGTPIEIFGPESSGKTNLVLLAIAQFQRRYGMHTSHQKRAAFIDAENSLDPIWARKLGVDIDALIYIKPDFAEQVVDMAEALLEAPDIGFVALDSLAAIATVAEIENSAEKATPGGNSLISGKFAKKCVLAMSRAEKAILNGDRSGPVPCLVWVNQTRTKFGVMFGDPETTPGGNAPKFAAGLRVRLYGKNVVDKKISEDMPIMKDISFAIRKWKVPIISTNSKFEMVTVPHKGMPIGYISDWEVVGTLMEQAGLWVPQKKGVIMLGETFDTQKEAITAYQTHEEIRALVHRQLIEIGRKQLIDAEGDYTIYDDVDGGDFDIKTGEVKS